jgi:hypothetical protein
MSVAGALLKKQGAANAPPKENYSTIVATMAKLRDATPPLDALEERLAPPTWRDPRASTACTSLTGTSWVD